MYLLENTGNYLENIKSPNRYLTMPNIQFWNGSRWRSTLKNLPKITLSDYSTDNNNITMGSVVGAKCTIYAKSVTSSFFTQYSSSPFRLTMGVYENKNNPSVFSLLYSTPFVIDDIKSTKLRNGNYDVTITGYDLSYTMTHEYVTKLANPTAIEIVTEIAEKYGLTVSDSVAEKIAEIETSETRFTPLSGFTCKQTLGYMAGCYGCFVKINNDLEIEFDWYKQAIDPNIEKNRIHINGGSVSEKEYVINLIETGTKNNPIVYPDNASGYSINFENPYITQELAQAIYNQKIADYKILFKTGKIKYRGSPANAPGSIVTVTEIDGTKSTFYIMKRTLTFDGGLSETIESLGESETTINYKLTSPTQQKIDRALSRMEEAIKNATDIITQTKGSVFEFIPIDENDPTKGNSGWKLYSTEIGSNNLILANSSGIGFSSNGGQSFNALALYIDENGVGHINANCIDVGKLSASVIDTSTLVVSTENVRGLNDELNSLFDSIETATDTANIAKDTADTANDNASNALLVANTANTTATSTNLILGGLTALENGVTVIKGSTILTGSVGAAQIGAGAITAEKLDAGAITAEKVNVGWQSGNCATGWTSDNESYITITSDSDYNYNPKITMSSSYTGGNIDVNGIPFYASAGDVLRFGGRAYKKSSGDNGVYLKYSSKSDGYYNVVSYENTANESTGSITDIDLSYTVTQAGWYMITVAFNRQSSGAYVTNLYCYKDVKGEMIVNGIISSVDKNTYFDLNNSQIETADSSGYKTKLSVGGLGNYYGEAEVGGLRSVYANLGAGSAYELLYFTDAKKHPLRIATDKDNPDPYMDFIYDETFRENCINVYKQINITNAFFTSCRNIQSGILTGVTSSGASVIFNKSFMRTPRIICTPIQSHSQSDVGVTTVLTDVSYDGFTVRTNNVSGDWSYGSDVQWIAIDIP